MADEWNIAPRGRVCSACEQPFDDRQACRSLLAYDSEGYTRSDYCVPCWESEDRTSGSFSMWEGVFDAPPPRAEEPLKKETAESLLRRLLEDNDDESHTNVIYILGVMLERKRTLVERDVRTRRDGSLLRVYEHRRSGEVFLVPDPELRLDELEETQQQVVAILGGERRPASGQEDAPAAESEQSSAADDQQAARDESDTPESTTPAQHADHGRV